MIHSIRILLALVLLISAAGSGADDELPGRKDYAYGFPLGTTGGAEYFALDVPLEFYRSVTDPRLRDAGVFNASGQPVPRRFEHEPPGPEQLESNISLGLVPLFGEEPVHPEQLRLMLRQDSGGTVLEYETPDPGSAEQQEEGKPLTAYIVDARGLEETPEALDFTWTLQEQGFIGRVDIQDSNDLQNWRKLASATLADLDYEDTEITQKRINLARKPANYMRIIWRDMPDGWALDSLTGVRFKSSDAARRENVVLDQAGNRDSDREHLYEVGGYPPADRANLLLPGDNVVVRASIFYRLDDQEYWRQAHSGLFYNISRQGNQLKSSPAAMDIIRARHWKVRIDSGVLSAAPRLQLGWHPDRLEFLAQGDGPFELVAGRANDRLDGFPQQRMLGDSSIFRMLREAGEAGVADIGPRVEIGGAERLEIAPTSPLRIAALWAGLAGAIMLVGWLAWSLSREMRAE